MCSSGRRLRFQLQRRWYQPIGPSWEDSESIWKLGDTLRCILSTLLKTWMLVSWIYFMAIHYPWVKGDSRRKEGVYYYGTISCGDCDYGKIICNYKHHSKILKKASQLYVNLYSFFSSMWTIDDCNQLPCLINTKWIILIQRTYITKDKETQCRSYVICLSLITCVELCFLLLFLRGKGKITNLSVAKAITQMQNHIDYIDELLNKMLTIGLLICFWSGFMSITKWKHRSYNINKETQWIITEVQ